MRLRRGLLVVLMTAASLTLLAASASAESPSGSATASYRCKATSAGGQSWSIKQSNTNCRFARSAVRLAVERRRSPKNWRCRLSVSREFSPEPAPYRVRCYRGSKRVLALAH